MNNHASPLWPWAEQAPSWQSDLLRRLIKQAKLTDEDVDEVLANLAAGLTAPAVAPLFGRRVVQEDLPASPSGTGAVRLLGLTEIVRAGALRENASISFAPTGLTVVYGDNGAGKTTIARLVKQACRARVQDDQVHPNVFVENASGPQTYTLEIDRDGQRERIARRVGDGPDPTLGSVSVFDAVCADHYIAKGDEPAYVPRAVQLLERLANAQGQLRAAATERKQRLAAGLPDFSALPRPTSVATAMQREDLAVAVVEGLARFDAVARDRLEHLDGLLESMSLNAERLASLQRELDRLGEIRTRVQGLAARASDQAIEEWRKAEGRAAELARALATLGTIEGLPLGPVGTPVWLSLWQAAHAFFRDTTADTEWGALCPLCQQGLDEDARERFAKFASLARGQLRRDHDEAVHGAREARSLLEKARTDARALVGVGGAGPWGEELRLFLEGLVARLTAALDGGDEGAEPLPPVDCIETATHERERAIAELRSLDDAQELAARRSERDELLARRQLAERREEALERARMLAKMRELDAIYGALGTGKLSRVQTKLANELITERLRKELDEIRGALRARYLKVDLAPASRGGRALVGLAFPRKTKAKLEEVFSGGERRTLALAFFLAEIAAADHDGTIVLDDPVSSLDADRRLLVARRLIEEAKRRQVIVFTHDPLLLILLRREHGKVPMTVRTCENRSGTAGHVSDGEPWTTSKAAALLQKLRSCQLKDARKYLREDKPEEYAQAVDALLKRLRKAWERAVAELFLGVVEPGSLEVQTKKLRPIVVTAAMVEAVRAAMGALSFDAHDQGTSMPQTLPSIEDLEANLGALERFLAASVEACATGGASTAAAASRSS